MFEINAVSTVEVGLHGSHGSPTTSKDSCIATTPPSGLLNEPDHTNCTAESGPGILMNARTLAKLYEAASAIAGTVDDSYSNLDDLQRMIAHGFPDLNRREPPPDAQATRIDLVLVTAREDFNEHKLLPHKTVFISAPGAKETGRESGVFHLPHRRIGRRGKSPHWSREHRHRCLLFEGALHRTDRCGCSTL